MRETIVRKTSKASQTEFRKRLDKTLRMIVGAYEGQYADSEDLLNKLHACDWLISDWTDGLFLQDPGFIQTCGQHKMLDILEDMRENRGLILDEYLWDLLEEEADDQGVYLDDQVGYENDLREAWEEQEYENRIADHWLHG